MAAMRLPTKLKFYGVDNNIMALPGNAQYRLANSTLAAIAVVDLLAFSAHCMLAGRAAMIRTYS